MITFFVCLLLFFSFSFVKFFSFKMRKKKLVKTEYYLKLVQLFFGHNVLFSEGDTPSNSFETL